MYNVHELIARPIVLISDGKFVDASDIARELGEVLDTYKYGC